MIVLKEILKNLYFICLPKGPITYFEQIRKLSNHTRYEIVQKLFTFIDKKIEFKNLTII